MGNKITIDYSLDKFVNELNIREINNISDVDIKTKLENLLVIFQNNKDYYLEYRKNEELAHNTGGNNTEQTKEEDENLQTNQEEEEIMKSKTFCNLITFMITLNYHSDMQEIYVLIIEVMNYLKEERDFLFYFMKNAAEQLCNMVTTINGNYIKILYHKATKLLIDVMQTLIKDSKLISKNLSTIRKIMVVPKKLIDTAYCKDPEIKSNLLVLMRLCLVMLRDLYEAYLKDKTFLKNKEYADFVKNTITEYHNSTLFVKLSDELMKKETDNQTQKIIVECLNYLSQIGFVISDQYIRSEKEVNNMLTIVLRSQDEEIVQESLKFLINFHISSFNLDCLNNFKLFQYDDNDIEEKLFALFQSSRTSENVKFLICCLFFCVSIVESIWNKLKMLNIIRPTSRFIYKFVSETFKPFSYSENGASTVNRMQKIYMLFKIFFLVSDDKNFKKIYHTEYFRAYFDIVILLFRVYHYSFRIDILQTMNIFTYFYDCKNKLLEEKNRPIILLIHKRLEELYLNMNKLYEIYSECNENKSKLVNKKESINLIEYKNKFQENISLLEDLALNTKNVFMKSAQEFGLLMSILVNLMLNQDYAGNISKVSCETNFFKETKAEKMNKKDKSMMLDNNVSRFNSQSLNNSTNSNIRSKDKPGALALYDQFFKMVKQDLLKEDNNTNWQVSRYNAQIVLARLINNPISKIEHEKGKSEQSVDEGIEMLNLNALHDMMKMYSNDQDVLHKLIYAINRFLSYSSKYKTVIETIKKIIDEVRYILYTDYSSSVIVNRECLRLLVSLTQFSENTLMWLKFDSKKVHVDYSNYSDVILNYRDPSTEWDVGDEEKERIIFPPYLKVKSYSDKMGVIFYGEHVLILPKRLDLGDSFTIWFRFFNPVINSSNWHVLLQDPTGVGAIIAIDSSRRKLGCFTEDGEFIDSGIDLAHPDLSKKWIQVAMCFRARPDDPLDTSKSEQTRLDWYVNATPAKIYDNEKITLPRTVQYIGNGRDYTEPFGVFCDIRIYKKYLNANNIKYLYYADENKKAEKNEYDLLYYIYHKAADSIIKNFLNSPDISEETFYFSIKFFNNIMANRAHRSKFINYSLISKVMQFFGSRKIETKKEVSKFLQTIA